MNHFLANNENWYCPDPNQTERLILYYTIFEQTNRQTCLPTFLIILKSSELRSRSCEKIEWEVMSGRLIYLTRLMKQNSSIRGLRRSCSSSSDCREETESPGPPSLPGTCCMSGCANCVWLDYAEEMVKYYETLGKKMELSELLNTLDDNVDDPMVKAFLTMELKSKYLFKK